MGLRTARRLVVRGRPPGRAAGRTGATKAHAASVRSVSYNRVLIVRSLWPDQRSFKADVNFSNTLSARVHANSGSAQVLSAHGRTGAGRERLAVRGWSAAEQSPSRLAQGAARARAGEGRRMALR